MQPAKDLLHYHLTEKLGEGGMGVVWKATDTTLGREVAIKILPADFAADEERLARFEREARLLASLNHPNIAGIFGIHKVPAADGQPATHFLAMELVPGEELAERLVNGPLPLEQALRTALEIATGLEAAHESGVIHRDLKPANVKLTKDGQAKVLDFGLAKAAEGAATASGNVSLSPTMTSAGTQAGMILGTASYMSPEQASGQPTDRRCDIWSFGVVLHELLTGNRLFESETVSHTLAAVLRAEIDLDDLPKQIPSRVEQLIRRCLERNPARRLRDIGEARILLDDELSGRADELQPVDDAPPVVVAGKGRFAWMALALVSLVGMLTMAAMTLRPESTPPSPVVQSILMAPSGWDFAPGAPLAVSRDGRQVAFVAYPRADNEEAGAGSIGLWVRDLDSTEARRLADADTASNPFWSPDGRWIGFYANGQLNKIEADGGPVVPICSATDGRGGTWSESGTIVFQRAWNEGLMQVPAGGGTPEPLTTLDRDRRHIAHRWPAFLPDGRHFLFYVVSTTNPITSEFSGIYIGSLDSDQTRFLLKAESRALYSSGHLLYRAGSTLMAHPFDLSTLELAGDRLPVASDVTGGAISWGGAQFGASEDDVLVHLRGRQAAQSVLTWRDHDGNLLETIGEPGGYWDPALSNDGSRLAVAVGTDAADIWIYELERDARKRVTFDPADDRQPLWSPNDRRLAYSSAQQDAGEIWIAPTSGEGDAQLVYTAGTSITLSDWSNDGRLIFFDYQQLVGDNDLDIWVFDLQTSEAREYLSGKFSQSSARLSPDGEWLAFESEESGNSEIYVQRFPEADGRWVVSNDGGVRGAYTPVWGDDGRELFYLRGNSLQSVPVTPGAGFAFGTPQTLFGVIVKSGGANGIVVTDNGQRILTNELPPADPNKAGARLIQNWATSVTRTR
ncbi:serine/threonine-protein kinase [bacterium]|nr:serine/threonine-protein kinase [bacterium]